MSIIESVGVALFLVAIVFLALCMLFLCIKLFSAVVTKVERTFTR